MTLMLTPKQLAKIIADAVRATLVQTPSVDELDAAARAIGNNAAQAALAYAVEDES